MCATNGTRRRRPPTVKHGVDFADAIAALRDVNRLEASDDRFAYAEERLRVIGLAEFGILFVVVVLRDEQTQRIRLERPLDMSKTAISNVTIHHGDDLPPGDADWSAVAAMTDDEVMDAALADPDAQPSTDAELSRMRRVSRVKLVRERLGMTQAAFALAYRLPVSTLRDWEQHRSVPDAPAQALLLAIERDPEALRRLLADQAA